MSKQVSQARIEANRRNAQRSTGPRTDEGKAQSSRNAVTHGLFTEFDARNATELAAVTGPTIGDAHTTILAAFTENFHPADPLEIALVARLASLQHRLHRITAIESGTFDQAMTSILELEHHPQHAAPGQTTVEDCLAAPKPTLLAHAYGRTSKTLNLLSFYEARLSRDFQRALNELRHTQMLRQANQLELVRTEPVNDTSTNSTPEIENEKTNPTATQPLETASISVPEPTHPTEHSTPNGAASDNEWAISDAAIPPAVNAETAPPNQQ